MLQYVVTTNEIVKKLVLLRRWHGKTLSPTPELCDFSVYFGKLVKSFDFQSYATDHKFQAVIGFLPLSYIGKCLEHLDGHGELIVCTPKMGRHAVLQKKLYQLGTITDIIQADKKIIWRFVKDDFSHKTLVDGKWQDFVLL
jgi:hypothetical protein